MRSHTLSTVLVFKLKCLINSDSMFVQVKIFRSKVSMVWLRQLIALPMRAILKFPAVVSSYDLYVVKAIMILSNKSFALIFLMVESP